MAHFAKLNDNNIVESVQVFDNDLQTPYGTVGSSNMNPNIENWIGKTFGGRFKQCSYNSNFRGNYPGIGDTFDEEHNEFIPKQNFPSWTYSYSEHKWKPSIAFPNFIQYYSIFEGLENKLSVAVDNGIYYNNVDWDEVNQLFFGWKFISGVKPDPVILKKCTWNGTVWTETNVTKQV